MYSCFVPFRRNRAGWGFARRRGGAESLCRLRSRSDPSTAWTQTVAGSHSPSAVERGFSAPPRLRANPIRPLMRRGGGRQDWCQARSWHQQTRGNPILKTVDHSSDRSSPAEASIAVELRGLRITQASQPWFAQGTKARRHEGAGANVLRRRQSSPQHRTRPDREKRFALIAVSAPSCLRAFVRTHSTRLTRRGGGRPGGGSRGSPPLRSAPRRAAGR